MELLDTLNTVQNVLNSVVNAITPSKESEETTDQSSSSIDYNSFSDLFSNILKENNIINSRDDLKLNNEESDADNSTDSNNLLEDILVNVASSMLFNNIDKDKNKMLDNEEQKKFADFINDMYNTGSDSDIVEPVDEMLTNNLDIEA